MAGLKSKQMSKIHVAEAFWCHLRTLVHNRVVGGGREGDRGGEGGEIAGENEPFSVSTLARNFNVLSHKGQEVGAIVRSLGGIFTWRHPDRTLLCLMLFTWGSIYPHYFLIYPVLYVLVFMSNKYLQKHALKPMLVSGDRALAMAADDGAMAVYPLTYIENDMFGWLWDLNISGSRDHYACGNLFDEMDVLLDDHDLQDDSNQEASLLKNMEDIQHTTSKILRFEHSVESKINAYCSFNNDLESTKLFLKMFTVVTIAITLGPYIPWRVVFILTVWILMLVTHPNRAQLVANIINSPGLNSAKLGLSARSSKPTQRDRGPFSSTRIIHHEPIVKHVQVFELQQQNATVENKYQASKYTNNVFCINDECRKQRKMPEFTNTLLDIKPPPKWQFVHNSHWEIDTKNEWVGDMNIQNQVFVSSDNWVYDLTREFRRRRLSRQCSFENL